MSKAWMPLYVGDYLGDTTHLNQGQHGAYLLFIMHYWQRGSLPGDHEECYCIAKAMDKQSRCNADKVLKQFFVLKGGLFTHARIDAELGKSAESYKRRAGAAHARWSGKKQVQSKSNGDALHQQSQSQSQSLLRPTPPNPPLSPHQAITVRDRRKLNDLVYALQDEHLEWTFEQALETACAQLMIPLSAAKAVATESGLKDAISRRATA